MTTLQKQQFFEHTIYATIAILIFATPIINALLMAYQTNGKTEITRPAIDMWIITSPFFFLFLINNYVLIPVLLLYLEAYNNQNQSEISNHKPLIVSTF